jgi:hypothetical protein
MDEQAKQSILAQYLERQKGSTTWGRLPEHPTPDDLLKFSNIRRKKKWKNNNRYRRKFYHNWQKYVPDSIYREFMAKVIMMPLRRRINYSEIARRLVTIEPLPPGALAYADESNN